MARQYKENDLPLDMICMDIDYMQDYADFTVNKQRFPDLAALSAELKAQGIRLVPIMMRVCASTRKTRLCRGPCKRFLLHQSRRHPLCGGGVARQGLLADFLRPDVRGVVRPAVQGTDRLRHRGLLERYERTCAVLLTRAAQGFL